MTLKELHELGHWVKLDGVFRAASLNPTTMRVAMHRNRELSQAESEALDKSLRVLIDLLRRKFERLYESSPKR